MKQFKINIEGILEAENIPIDSEGLVNKNNIKALNDKITMSALYNFCKLLDSEK